MIYLEEIFNLALASPQATDNFVEFSEKQLVPIIPELGARLVAAWSCNFEWFCQVRQIMEFDDLDALKTFRINASQSKAWGEYAAGLEEHAPVRRSQLLELLGPVPPDVLHQAIADSKENPIDGYLQATLEVGIGHMDTIKAGLAESHKTLPIIASWRPVSGSPNEIIDIWKSPETAKAYAPAGEWEIEFFQGLRMIAPKERAFRMLALPYSPLL